MPLLGPALIATSEFDGCSTCFHAQTYTRTGVTFFSPQGSWFLPDDFVSWIRIQGRSSNGYTKTLNGHEYQQCDTKVDGELSNAAMVGLGYVLGASEETPFRRMQLEAGFGIRKGTYGEFSGAAAKSHLSQDGREWFKCTQRHVKFIEPAATFGMTFAF